MKRKIKKLYNNWFGDSWLIDDRWQIYADDGTIYDTKKMIGIPPEIFKIRDKLLKK